MPDIDRSVTRDKNSIGQRLGNVQKYTGPSSYATDGDSFKAADVGLGVIEYFPSFLAHSGSAVRLCVYDFDAEKVVWYVPDTGAEVTNATNLSTFSARIEVQGK